MARKKTKEPPIRGTEADAATQLGLAAGRRGRLGAVLVTLGRGLPQVLRSRTDERVGARV